MNEEHLKICGQMIEACVVECRYASKKSESEVGEREIAWAIEKLKEAKLSIKRAENVTAREACLQE